MINRIYAMACLILWPLLGFGQNSNRLSIDVFGGYAFPINASYIDTYQNEDIYWNPNTGFNLDTRLTVRCNDIFSVSFPFDVAIGFTKHPFVDKDGRVVRPPRFLRDFVKEKLAEYQTQN